MKRIILTSILSLALLAVGMYVHYMTTDVYQYKEVRKIYKQLLARSGQTQEALPLYLEESDEENAYNDGTKVVIFTGLIQKAKNWDEISLILGHEIAHGMLWHLKMKLEDKDLITVAEANADKLGAYYMMAAGYDICKGREIFKRWKETGGNHQNQSHPNHSFRYDELNINCE